MTKPLIKSLKIHGYRGFSVSRKIDFAIPNGDRGSGLSILVGPNNAGKSSIVEALNIIARTAKKSISEGKRNQQAGDRVSFVLTNTNGEEKELKSVPEGGSETKWENQQIEPSGGRISVLPSRRLFEAYFGKGEWNREQYAQNIFPDQRGAKSNFAPRLFKIQNNRDEFNRVLSRVLNPVPEWYIEQNEQNQHYLKFKTGDFYHNSEGMGDGLISLLFLVDSLYDSREDDVIVIDEPELSLHPQFQKSMRNLICEYASSRQIIYATHSPQFIDWDAIISGAKIIRVYLDNYSSTFGSITENTRGLLSGLMSDLNNPHVLGLDASEVFFLDDKVILVEGQEDVIFYKKILKQLDIDIKGAFYGWGVGGAHKIRIISSLLKDLGFSKVVGILDKNKEDLIPDLIAEFPKYSFISIPADDVRSKQSRPAKPEIKGLIDSDGNLDDKCRAPTKAIFDQIKDYLL